MITTAQARIGANFMYADDVGGEITIRMNNAPFNEAFNNILANKGLAATQDGSIVRITTLQALKSERSQASLTTQVFQLNYLKPADAKAMLDNVIRAEGRTGIVNTDSNSNLILVTDTPAGIYSISRLIPQIDKKSRQILIEAKLVEVNHSKDTSLGINWSAYGGNYGKIDGRSGYNWFGIPNPAATSIVGKTLPTVSTAGGTGVNFPTSVSEVPLIGGFRFGRVASNYFLDATLSASEQKGNLKILSDPKIATINNKEAKINITTSIPYITEEAAGSVTGVKAEKVVYVTTGIELTVTPTLNEGNRITLKVKPSVSQKAVNVPMTKGGAPGIDTRSAETTIITKDGETIVIGGLIYEASSDMTYKVPLLGDIPVLGWLFKKKTTSTSKMELLIFVTPKIIES
ncbi:MAG: type IV pilus secretin PilQ [Elusimicrobia bacterium]|nr:type IV pilus secretin PilQ [Elusimicrobiota bacterium]